MSKIYFSRSITRTMSADHPVGDPTGGAAYGEKNDPVSAAFALYGMSASYGAMMAGSIMAGVTFAGSALSLVGNITGNKTLSKIGMVAGVIGGLGQMGAFGETAKTAKWSDVGIGSSATPPPGTNATTGSLQGSPVKDGSLAEDIAANEQRTAARRMELAGPDGTVRGGAGMRDYSQAGVNEPVTGGGNTAFRNANTTAPAETASTGGFREITNPAGAGQTGEGWRYFRDAATGQSAAIDPSGKYFLDGEQITGAAGGKFGFGDYANKAWDYTKGIVSAPLEFAKDNPYGALALGQTAQPIADYLSGKTDAEIDALEAQTKAMLAQAGYADANALKVQEEIQKEKLRRENLNAGYMQVDTGITVNTPQQGLIAQQMPRG